MDVDPDETTYCYCNGVSYGAMVACDSDDCEREWFHLECVGLKVPPKQNGMYPLSDLPPFPVPMIYISISVGR